MGNPRRDAFEYGVLITLGTSMAAAYAFLLAYSSQRGPDGKRQRLPRVDLDEQVDLGKAWEDMKNVMGEMRWGKDPTSSLNGAAKGPVTVSAKEGESGAASNLGKEGDQTKK